MANPSRSPSRHVRLICWPLFSALAVAMACGKADPTPAPDSDLPSAVFGGASGIKEPTLAGTTSVGQGGGAGSSGNLLPDPCAKVPEGRLAMIDDFEDGDSIAIPESDRESYWFTLHDDSAGTITPDGLFKGVPGGAHGSTRSAHITASGFSIWGAAFAANISHIAGGIRCPFNASHFAGLRFYARGAGQVRVSLQVPDIIDEQYGGTCKPASEICYDSHGVWITLTPNWQYFTLPWSQFVQRSFGKDAPFRREAIMSVQFTFEIDQLPGDAWLDDVAWDDGSRWLDPNSGAAGASGEGGAAGSSGLAGATGEGGASGESAAFAEGGTRTAEVGSP